MLFFYRLFECNCAKSWRQLILSIQFNASYQKALKKTYERKEKVAYSKHQFLEAASPRIMLKLKYHELFILISFSFRVFTFYDALRCGSPIMKSPISVNNCGLIDT